MEVAGYGDMTLKNIFMLGSVIAGAAYLRDKGRRDRLVGQARGVLDKAKTRATQIAGQIQSKGSESTGFDSGVGKSANYSGVGGSSATDTSFGGSRTYR